MKHDTACDLLSHAQKMLTHLPVAVALFDAYDLRLLQAHPCFHAILDSSRQQGRAIGRRLTELFPHTEHTGSLARF
jgi:hypothetical protein